ncbi:MAG: hypothetical protein WC549_04175 [Actinomycetota bacterium]
MIPAIGFMIGFYIITRMLSFILRKEPRNENLFIKIFSGITIIVVIACMILLWQSSMETASLLDY